MNLISNSCTGSYIVRDFYKKQFSNPFVWCSLTPRDMIQLINNYDNVNWTNFDVNLYKNTSFNTQCVAITVDNLFTIKYPHYVLSETDTQVVGINVFSKDILEFSKEKFKIRSERLNNINESPIFLIGGTWQDQRPPKDFMNYVAESKYKHNVLLVDNVNIQYDNYKFAKWVYDTKLKQLQLQ